MEAQAKPDNESFATVPPMEEEATTTMIQARTPPLSLRYGSVAAVLLQTVLLGVVTVVCIVTTIAEPVTEWRSQTQTRYESAVESWTANYERTSLSSLGPELRIRSTGSQLLESRAWLKSPIVLKLDTSQQTVQYLYTTEEEAPVYPGSRYVYAGAVEFSREGSSRHGVSLFLDMSGSILMYDGSVESDNTLHRCLTSLDVYVHLSEQVWVIGRTVPKFAAFCSDVVSTDGTTFTLPLTITVRHVTDPENSVFPNPASNLFVTGHKGVIGVTLTTVVAVFMLGISFVVVAFQMRRTGACSQQPRSYEVLNM